MLPIKLRYLLGLWLLALCAMMVHGAPEPSNSVAADQFQDNMEDKSEDAVSMHKRPSFFVGSRYGRSGASAPVFATSKTRRLNVVPRNDRFFLGSRYGKRSNEYMSPYEQGHAAAAAGQLANASKDNDGNAAYMMSCIYMGVANFYRCNNVEDFNNILNQLTTTHTADEEQ